LKDEYYDSLVQSPGFFWYASIKDLEKAVISFGGEKYRYYRDLTPGYLPSKAAIIFVYPHEKPVRALKGFRYTRLEGYSAVKEFYSPDYGAHPPVQGEIDERRTLYWNPDVQTDNKGLASVSFYKNSSNRGISVHLEGITKEGRCIVHKTEQNKKISSDESSKK